MKNGEILRGLLSRFIALFLIPSKPPIPEPIITPVLYESSSLSDFQPESFNASFAAISAYSINGSIFFLSFTSIIFSEKSVSSPSIRSCPPTFEGKSLISKPDNCLIPDFPSISLFQQCSQPKPRGVHIPMPVTTTLLII